jgi:hypothetical protein
VTEATAMRPAWQAAALGFAITVALGAAVGVIAALASTSVHQDLGQAIYLYGRAFSPFIVIVTVAAFVIQRARLAQR